MDLNKLKMNKTTKRILIGVAVVGIAVGLYFGYKYIYKKATEENRYEYQVEGSDLIIVVYPNEVYFFDFMF